MWLDNLKRLKQEKGISTKQIVEMTRLPEKTITRIFSGDTENPRIDTVHRITTALGVYLDDVFVDTNVVVSAETITEVKETANAVEADLAVISAENTSLRNEITALTHEIELLQNEIKHKDEILKHKEEILDWHRFYNNRK